MWSTIQRPDLLKIDDRQVPIYSQQDLDIGEVNEKFTTSCWRGYIANFELRSDSLFLNKIRDCNGDNFDDATYLTIDHKRIPVNSITSLFLSGYSTLINAASCTGSTFIESDQILITNGVLESGDLNSFNCSSYYTSFDFIVLTSTIAAICLFLVLI